MVLSFLFSSITKLAHAIGIKDGMKAIKSFIQLYSFVYINVIQLIRRFSSENLRII